MANRNLFERLENNVENADRVVEESSAWVKTILPIAGGLSLLYFAGVGYDYFSDQHIDTPNNFLLAGAVAPIAFAGLLLYVAGWNGVAQEKADDARHQRAEIVHDRILPRH